MFVEAQVLSILVDREIRHFLDLKDAAYRESGKKRLRLAKRKYAQVSSQGGLLLRSRKQVAALSEIGAIEVTIDTDKSDVVPDLEELRQEKKRRKSEGAQPRDAGTGEERDSEGDEIALDRLDDTGIDEAAGGAESLGDTRRRAPSPVDIDTTARRRNFGPANTGWKVDISRETDQAFLQVISFGGDASLGQDDVIKVLEEEYGIRSGLDRELVGRVAKQASSSPNRVIRGHFPIATGQEPDPEAVGRIEFTCLEEVADDQPIAHEELKDSLARDSLPEVLAKPLTARLVMPGEELAAFLPVDDEQAASDIFGNIKPAAGGEALLRAGGNVKMLDGRYVAELHGAVCISDDEISVVPPLWVSPDAMEAHFIRIPQAGPEPILTEDWLRQTMEAAGVTHGILGDGLAEMLADSGPVESMSSVLIARGTEAVAGEDGSVYLRYRRPIPFGKETDLIAIEESTGVRTGDMLAEVTPVTEGQPGIDVRGGEVNVSVGETETLTVGANVRTERPGEREYFYAEIDGRARVADGMLSVNPVTYIQGNVDGALQVEDGSDVHIRGSVRAGAAVTVGGCIVVEGVVEGGAHVQARDDVLVAKGIVGRDTRVVAMRSVTCKFAQNSSVVAGEDVTITGHLINARVRAGGSLVIMGESGEQDGSAVGGEISASRSIEVRRVTRGGGDTTLIIGPNPDVAARMRKLDDALEFCRTNTLRIFRTLGISEIEATDFKRVIERSPPEKRKPVMQLLGRLKELVNTRERSLEGKRALVLEQERLFDEARISIAEHIDADVKIRIGDAAMMVLEDRAATEFERKGDTVEARDP